MVLVVEHGRPRAQVEAMLGAPLISVQKVTIRGPSNSAGAPTY